MDISNIYPWFRVQRTSCCSTAKRLKKTAPQASLDVDACAHDIEAFGRLISGTQRGGGHQRCTFQSTVQQMLRVIATLGNQPALHASLRFTKGSTISYS